jgi:hypothetical protein
LGRKDVSAVSHERSGNQFDLRLNKHTLERVEKFNGVTAEQRRERQSPSASEDRPSSLALGL